MASIELEKKVHVLREEMNTLKTSQQLGGDSYIIDNRTVTIQTPTFTWYDQLPTNLSRHGYYRPFTGSDGFMHYSSYYAWFLIPELTHPEAIIQITRFEVSRNDGAAISLSLDGKYWQGQDKVLFGLYNGWSTFSVMGSYINMDTGEMSKVSGLDSLFYRLEIDYGCSKGVKVEELTT